MPNELIHETSPYLLQHANNPVNWFPWGSAALEKAREENKPIFLSIGYTACHWCHVMERESFEDLATASLLNNNFISIKVDREERPDLDSIYMNAVVAMTGQGGWPMSVFMTPDCEPFFGGTYFPPTRRYGMPSFQEVLNAVIKSWQNDSGEIRRVGQQLTRHLQETSAWTSQNENPIRYGLLKQASQALINTYDWNAGGWGKAPRFPQPMAIDFLHMQATRGVEKALNASSHALEKMSRGGLYDVVGGGFHRYSTDDTWLVPHFEKMLYDNAQLALVYLHNYLLTGNIFFRHICTETLDFILRELTQEDGGFFSSLDADSEGEEGLFYTWTQSEIDQCLQKQEDKDLFYYLYSIQPSGNFERRIILQRKETFEHAAAGVNLSTGNLLVRLTDIHKNLLQYRQGRIRPLTDDKVLVSWNALALRAFAEAARYLNRDDYLEASRKNASFLLRELYKNNRLQRSWRNGQSRHNAFLDDYAGLALGLLELYQSDPDIHWYNAASRLIEDMHVSFFDPRGGFFDTSIDHGELITRPKEIQDNATPCGNALAAGALLRMAGFSDNSQLHSTAEAMLSAVQDFMVRHPTAFGYWLQDLDFFVGPVQQIAMIGDHNDPAGHKIIEHIWHTYRPRTVLAISKVEKPIGGPSLLNDRGMIQTKPTVYICENFTCNLPVTEIELLKKQIE